MAALLEFSKKSYEKMPTSRHLMCVSVPALDVDVGMCECTDVSMYECTVGMHESRNVWMYDCRDASPLEESKPSDG